MLGSVGWLCLSGLFLAGGVPLPNAAQLKNANDRFSPVELTADLSGLPENERQAVAKLVEAARLFERIFLRQVWSGNEALEKSLALDSTPLGQERLRAFQINKGPWSRLDQDAPFLPNVPPKPEGANVYPSDATKEELETWLKQATPAERERAQGFFTVIRREQGSFTGVPYSREYGPELARAAALLKDAASLTAEPSLKAYLSSRAEAFLSDDYYPSDLAWMNLDAAIEPVLGPYEVYEDRWFNAKAFFEAYVTVRDDAETRKLQGFSQKLQEIENRLPLKAEYRNPKLGPAAPIRVVNSLFASGDANHGVQTAAFNLPNDERVVREKGSKRVMLRNVQEAKFQKVLLPISRRVLSAIDQKAVTFEAFFTAILMHELMHGLGPHEVKAGELKGKTVREALQQSYSAIEEAKADISGLFALQSMMELGSVPRTLERPLYVTFLVGAFRTLRFGLSEAHARGQALILDSLLERGAVAAKPDGTFTVNLQKMREAISALTAELMTLQAEGQGAKASQRLEWVTAELRPEVRAALARLKDIPADIAPRYTTAEGLVSTQVR